MGNTIPLFASKAKVKKYLKNIDFSPSDYIAMREKKWNFPLILAHCAFIYFSFFFSILFSDIREMVGSIGRILSTVKVRNGKK